MVTSGKTIMASAATEYTLLRAISLTIKARRLKLHLSQQVLAERSGLHHTYVSDLERSARNLALSNLRNIARALEYSVSDLVSEAELRCIVESEDTTIIG
jgi:transcriptional regulator with XRE-family HTH domain